MQKAVRALPGTVVAEPENSFTARVALRVLQFGVVAIILVVAPYEVFDLDRFFVPKELVLHFVAFLGGLFSLGKMQKVRVTRVDILLVGFLLVSALSTVLATNKWLAARSFAMSVSGCILFWTARSIRKASLSDALTAALAAGVVIAAITSLLQAYGLETIFFSENRVPGGTLSNRNFVGHLAAFGLPVLLLSAFRTSRPGWFVAGVVGVILVVWVLVITRSRAAWLGAAAAVFTLVAGGLFAPAFRSNLKALGRFTLLLLCIGTGVLVALLVPNTLRWTSSEPYLETAKGVLNYEDGSGRGRLIQYQTTLMVTVSSPLFGVGPGNWAVVYPTHADADDVSLDRSAAGMTTNPWPSSDWMALLSERGLAGFLLFGFAWLGIALGAWRGMRKADNARDSLASLVVLATLAGITVTGAFDAVMLLAWPTFIFWATAGALWAEEAASEKNIRPSVRVLVVLVLCFLSGAGTIRSAGQLEAMSLYAADKTIEDLEKASRLDPGNYRVHLRLAQRIRNDREKRCEHALAAHALFPEAAAAARLARRCE